MFAALTTSALLFTIAHAAPSDFTGKLIEDAQVATGFLNEIKAEALGGHLWFNSVTLAGYTPKPGQPEPSTRCGDIDAAQRMPAELFEPKNFLALTAYVTLTLKYYSYFGQDLELGRCKSRGYPTEAGTIQGIYWTTGALMNPICLEKCNCVYSSGFTHTCRDVPDDPKAATWCSLCGPKFNAPITVNLFNKVYNDDDVSEEVSIE